MNNNVLFLDKLFYRFKSVQHTIQQYRQTTNETVIADTEYGKVKGIKRNTLYNEPYYSFEGIPYAQPPFGELRFKAPQRPTPWEDVKDCTNAKDKAVQVNFLFNRVEGSEDCLFLNVYTNNLSPNVARPVLVWIHGGGFIIGEANRDWYGPDYFMKKDVVLVTIQYRLGVLGFLSLNSPELNIPGNAGLKDQVMALKWIKNNCASFGGDPDNITLFGESAGAASTHYMLLSEQTRGLFHRGILMSGNAICPWALTDSHKRAYTIAKLAGYNGENDEKKIFEFLSNAKAKDLIRLEEKVLTLQERQERIMFAFGPTIEPYESTDCVIPKHPKELAKVAWSNSLPIMIGNCSKEMLLLLPELKANPNAVHELDSCVNFVPPELIDTDRTSEVVKAHGLTLKKAHVSGEKPTADDYMDICSYHLMLLPMHRLINLRFKYASGAPIYLYRFDFDSEVLINAYRMMRFGRGVKGVSHADELSYLFTNTLTCRVSKTSRDYKTVERMLNLWIQFATNGDPNNQEIADKEKVKWEPLQKSEDIYQCLNISEELKFINLPEMEKLKVWETCFDKNKELF